MDNIHISMDILWIVSCRQRYSYRLDVLTASSNVHLNLGLNMWGFFFREGFEGMRDGFISNFRRRWKAHLGAPEHWFSRKRLMSVKTFKPQALLCQEGSRLTILLRIVKKMLRLLPKPRVVGITGPEAYQIKMIRPTSTLAP